MVAPSALAGGIGRRRRFERLERGVVRYAEKAQRPLHDLGEDGRRHFAAVVMAAGRGLIEHDGDHYAGADTGARPTKEARYLCAA